MNIQRQKGFTLAELLVVVAIIGLVSSILIVNLSRERLRARDTAIMETMDTLRKRAEVDRDQDGNYDAVCNDPGPGQNGTLSTTGYYFRINESVKTNNGGVNILCNKGPGAATFAAWTPLRLEPNTYWCIDSKFQVKKLTAAPPIDATECP